MNNKLRFIMRKVLHKSEYDKRLIRYFNIIDNYLKGYSIKRVEPINKMDNEPNIEILDILAKYLKVEINYSSELFEGRLKKRSSRYSFGSLIWVDRFFERINLLEENNITLDINHVKNCLNMANVVFYSTYSPLDHNQRALRKTMMIVLFNQLRIKNHILANLIGISYDSYKNLEWSNFNPKYKIIEVLYHVIVELTLTYDLSENTCPNKKGSGFCSFYNFLVNERIKIDESDEDISVINYILAYYKELDQTKDFSIIIKYYRQYIGV